MRRFSSYGPINPREHYHAPREELVAQGVKRLTGEHPQMAGHYITVWAPRQCGKTWLMQEAVRRIIDTGQFEVAMITMEAAKEIDDEAEVMEVLVEKMSAAFQKQFPPLTRIRKLPSLFTKKFFSKPVILIIDEFDALEEKFINHFAAIFRDINVSRTNEVNKPTEQKTYLLHSLALIGVRSVLGIENVKGSPFNVQTSLHVPDLSYEEVKEMFLWYRKESGQTVEPEVIDRLFYETRGQPGLTCWFGELLTDTFNKEKDAPISLKNYNRVYAEAAQALPNNNILNIISKAKVEPYKEMVLELFKTDREMEFSFDDESLNYLYMNGIIDLERKTGANGETHIYCRFACPFVQSRLFNHFARELFRHMGTLVKPFADLNDVVNENELNIPGLMKLYQIYLDNNKEWLFKNAPRRTDLKIYEAVYHFNLFSYLHEFLRDKGGAVTPEFPTGNGKIDLLVQYKGKPYGMELKSYSDYPAYPGALKQAALYGNQLNLEIIYLVFFVTAIDEENRKKLGTIYIDPETGIKVDPIFIATGD